MKSATVAAAAVLAVAIAGYGLYLVLVGLEWTLMPAVPADSPPGEPATTTVPAMQGLIPLAGGLIVLIGLIRGRGALETDEVDALAEQALAAGAANS